MLRPEIRKRLAPSKSTDTLQGKTSEFAEPPALQNGNSAKQR